MLGCIRKLGCLVILALIAGIWYWYARVEPSRAAKGAASTTARRGGWEPLSQSNAERGQRAVASLAQRSGPVFANLSASEAASYIFLAASRQQLPPSAESVSSAIIGDRLYVRANVALNEIGGKKLLGPLSGLISDRDSVQLGGTMSVIRPGLGQFLVQAVKLGKIEVPSPLVPRLVAEIRRGVVPEGVAQNGFPMPMPSYISDIRISNGRITIYKNTP
jgi:hypothetical protein